MTEKTSRLVSNAKELMKDQQFKEALCICENILKNDENNINALLIATKCWMDMDLTPINVKHALEKVLLLKPNHPLAIQGLRKFYEKHFLMFFNDAIEFYYGLYKSRELSDKDIDIITTDIAKQKLSIKAEELVLDCLQTRLKDKSDEICLLTFCHISMEKYIVDRDTVLLTELFVHLTNIVCDDPSETIVFIQNLSTLVKAVMERKDPETVLSIITELNIKHVYASILFGKLLCGHYMMLDCEDTIDLGLQQLQNDVIYNHESLQAVIINIRIQNLIHLGDVEKIEACWLEVDENVISKYLWCQSFAVGYNRLSDDSRQWPDFVTTFCTDLPEYQQLLCRVITHETLSVEIHQIHQIFSDTPMTSFEWYLWSNALRALNRPDYVFKALECALKQPNVFFKAYVDLAEICSKKNEYSLAVKYLEAALGINCSLEIVEALVDLHIHWKKYEEPLALLELLDLDFFPVELLLKFIDCLSKLERLTDAICLAQRVVKRCRDESNHWQMLGDLYLRRDNVNLANKAYEKCVQLIGETADNCARLGNVSSLLYQETMDENKFSKSLASFDRSLVLGTCKEALEGKASLLFLHAEVSLKQMMLSSAVRDIDSVIALITSHADNLTDSEFHMNMLGKVILLSLMGSIDKMIDIGPVKNCYFPNAGDCDAWDLALKCFERSIAGHSVCADSYYNCGLLELCQLNRTCVGAKRGQIIDPGLYRKTEKHFKNALSLDSKYGDAWKYLGYLYLKHGTNIDTMAFDIQHCLTMALSCTSDIDKLNDPEAAFYLGLLYIRENWFDCAREIFKKIQMDYPVDPIGSIGLYLLGDKDEKQSELARALMTSVYRDEATNANDSCYQLNCSLVALFVENMGFLVHSRDTGLSHGGVEPSSLVEALRTALSSAWTKYLAYSAIGCTSSDLEEKQFKEYGTFLGIVELLLGDFDYGKKLVLQSTIKTESPTNTKLHNFLELDESLTSTNGSEVIVSLSKSLNLNLNEDHVLAPRPSFTVTQFDELLLSAIADHLSPSNTHAFSLKYAQTLISAIPSLNELDRSVDDQLSILLAVGSFLVTIADPVLASNFLDIVSQNCSHVVNNDDRFPRVLCRLKLLQSSPFEVLGYLYDQCLKQPLEMNRWLNYLEFGLEYSQQLSDSSIAVEKLFFVTNRPWCMAPLDIERYSRIVARFAAVVSTAALKNHRLMFMKALRLFPEACLPLLSKYCLVQ